MEEYLWQQDGTIPVVTRWKDTCGNKMERYLWQQDGRIPVATR